LPPLSYHQTSTKHETEVASLQTGYDILLLCRPWCLYELRTELPSADLSGRSNAHTTVHCNYGALRHGHYNLCPGRPISRKAIHRTLRQHGSALPGLQGGAHSPRYVRHDEFTVRYGLARIYHPTNDIVAETLQAIRGIQPIRYPHLQPLDRRFATVNCILDILPLAPDQQDRSTYWRMFPPGLVPADWVSIIPVQHSCEIHTDSVHLCLEMSQADSSFSQSRYTPGWAWSRDTSCHTFGLWCRFSRSGSSHWFSLCLDRRFTRTSTLLVLQDGYACLFSVYFYSRTDWTDSK
jgi:hypothetical protein